VDSSRDPEPERAPPPPPTADAGQQEEEEDETREFSTEAMLANLVDAVIVPNYETLAEQTADFAAVMEEVSGRRLAWFFDQWLRRPGVPELEIAWRFDEATSTVELAVAQLGPTIYRLPLDVEAVLDDGRAVRGRVDVEGERAATSLLVPARPDRLRIDPDTWLLMRYTALR